MSDKFKDWQKRASETARNVSTVGDRYVHDHTWTTVAVAAILGCLVGYLLTNRD